LADQCGIRTASGGGDLGGVVNRGGGPFSGMHQNRPNSHVRHCAESSAGHYSTIKEWSIWSRPENLLASGNGSNGCTQKLQRGKQGDGSEEKHGG